MREYLPTLTLLSPSPRERDSYDPLVPAGREGRVRGTYDRSYVCMNNPG